MAKRGRPEKDNPKDLFIHVRFSEEDMKMLEHVVKWTGHTKSEIIRIALNEFYDSLCF